LIILIPFLLFALPAFAQEMPLVPEKNSALVTLLNDMRMLGERGTPPEDLGYIVRVIASGSEGECDGTPQSCPTEYAYIAISELGESPPMNLYRLPDSYGWTLDSWVDFPKGDPAINKFVVLRMTRQVIAKDPSKGWFVPEQFEIRVNAYSATMRKL
jgi:hypothetical protein